MTVKIIDERKSSNVRIDKVSAGEFFMYLDELYIKNEKTLCATSIYKGVTWTFEGGTLVTPLKNIEIRIGD